MNEPNPLSKNDPAPPPELGANPGEVIPIPNVVACIEALLRDPRRVMFRLRQQNERRLPLVLLGISLVCSLAYGFILGLFSGGEQLYLAPLKTMIGLLLSGLICLPSLYIFSALGGSKASPADVAGLLFGLLALATILLIGFAPVAWIFSQSTESIGAMGALHLIFWFIAVYFGLRFLNAGFRHMEMRTREGVKLWTIIFTLVALQMTTALRPILGTADTILPTEKKFFLVHWGDHLQMGSEY